MKVVDRIDNKEHIEKLTEEQRDDFFTKLVMGKDITEEVDTARGTFIVKYPKAKDILAVRRLMAFRRNYKPSDSFDPEFEMINTMASTLDIAVVSGPEWFEDAKKANPNFSFLEVPSRLFLAELYGKASSFREKAESRLDETGGAADQRVPPKAGNDDPVDGGAFGGLSSEPDDTAA